jgi:hypothetical protein
MDLGLGLPLHIVTAGAVGIGLFVLLLIVIAVLRRRRLPAGPPPQDLRINLAELPTPGPPAEGPRFEFYGTPVRLAVLVLAPAGRNNTVPTGPQLTEALENLLPGLAGVVTTHRPVFRTWPAQLSTQGFVTSFFAQVPLPGDRGKGTPWCSAAGRFETGQQQLLAGVVCIADKPNSLSQIAVQHAGQWMDVLRVKG